ncbi:unnamed protein product [Acanthosepion pharaonis]|uniref:Uncharacterized protein n=1 Tax=Acanthosepion pharaonis TaxID=158019 RepID=A0A812ET38_ACAPH|nr:unnamed protein product [Sepia pharaonis]
MLLSRIERPDAATGGWRRRARSTSRVDEFSRPELCWYHHRFAPGQGIAGTLQIQLQNQVEKTKQLAVGAAEPPAKTYTNRLFLRMGPAEQHKVSSGHRSSYQCDTPKEQQDRKGDPYKLQAANGSTIETYGAKTLTLNIGTLSRHNTTGISVTTCHGREYIEILNRYWTSFNHSQVPVRKTPNTAPYKDQWTAYFFPPRRLPLISWNRPKEFNNMLQDGFIPPSDSPYASPLHLILSRSTDFSPPKDETDYTTALSVRSSLSASARRSTFTQVQTSRDRLDLEHRCFHSPTSKLSP